MLQLGRVTRSSLVKVNCRLILDKILHRGLELAGRGGTSVEVGHSILKLSPESSLLIKLVLKHSDFLLVTLRELCLYVCWTILSESCGQVKAWGVLMSGESQLGCLLGQMLFVSA
jgi:hypothetical protein